MKKSITHKRKFKVEENDENLNDDEEILQIKDCIYFYAEVTPKNILKLITALDKATQYALQVNYDMNQSKVFLYINSFGGDAYSGLSAMDHIRLNQIPVITIADGYVASAATLILLGGSERKILSNAKVLIHQLSTQFWGKYKDLLDEVANSKELMNTFKDIYGNYTQMKEHQIEDLIHKELHMNANQSLLYGFVDEIW